MTREPSSPEISPRPPPDLGGQLLGELARGHRRRVFPRGMRKRWWAFRLFDLLARGWPAIGPRRGVVVVRMDGIGDMALFRSVLDHYAAAFGVAPGDVTVLGCRSWQAIAEVAFAGYRVHCIDEHAFERHPLYRLREALWMRRQRFAVAVCDMYFRKALTADSLIWFSTAPRRVVSLPFVSARSLPEFAYYLAGCETPIETGVYPTHEVVRHYRFVSRLAGREIAPAPPRLPWRDTAPPIENGAPYAVINVGGNEHGRRWPVTRIPAVARHLLGGGYRVAFTGAPADAPLSQALALVLDEPGVIDLIGRTSLPRLLDLIGGAAALVSSDTGPAHLGVVLGTPTVVIVGGGHFGCFVPYPDDARPAHARFVHCQMACYHCFWRCDQPHEDGTAFPCVDAVAAEDVTAALDDLLDSRAGRAVGGPQGPDSINPPDYGSCDDSG